MEKETKEITLRQYGMSGAVNTLARNRDWTLMLNMHLEAWKAKVAGLGPLDPKVPGLGLGRSQWSR